MDPMLSIFKFGETRLATGFILERLFRWSLLLLSLLDGSAGFGQDNPPSEYHVEAAFLYHFASFVTWPPQAFDSEHSPITIGILGEDAFSEELENTVRNKTMNGRAFQVVRLEPRAVAQAKQCQIIFIGSSERKRMSEILEALKNTSVLTVSKMEHFTQSGGMINFVLDDKKVRFEINDDAARRAGLKISAKLLNLSRNKGIT